MVSYEIINFLSEVDLKTLILIVSCTAYLHNNLKTNLNLMQKKIDDLEENTVSLSIEVSYLKGKTERGKKCR